MSKQSDIARQFELPERQSKLATMLREEGLKDEQVYCICRSGDVSRFMIGCDNCEEWYHGDCINVTESQANKMRKFYCKHCREKHPSLEIKYKTKHSHHHHRSPSSSINKHCHDKERQRNQFLIHDKDKHHEKSKHSSKSHHRHEKHSISHRKSEKKRETCGECEACYVREDCGRCENCKDMEKFGGAGKLKYRCKKRQCHNFYHLSKKHTKISNLISSKSRNDHSYNTTTTEFSNSKIAKKNSIHITSFAEFATLSSKELEGPEKLDPSVKESNLSKALVTSSTGLSNTAEVSSPSRLLSYEDSSPSHATSAKPRPQLVARPQTVNTDLEKKPQQMKHEDKALSILRDKNNGDDLWQPKMQKIKKQRKEALAKKRRTRRDSSSDSDEQNKSFESQVSRQCLGPGCIKSARPASKYCTDECGLLLAETRIYSVLPQRITEWKMNPCVAEDNDRKQLEKIRYQQLEARKALQLLDEKHKDLDLVIENGKSAQIDPRADEETEDDASEGALVYCVTCGHEIPSRRAIKHMHSCYNKLESQMSFGSMYKTRIEGNNMFCDFYNASTRTYCKRLRVMCPEHTKEPKISNTEVCGFPLTSNLFVENGRVCRVSKKKCLKHYCWDKLRRANIDMERVRQCLKLDELVEQERQIRLAMTNRAGVLALMLHSTYDHSLADKIKKKQSQQSDHQYHQMDHQYHKDDHQYYQKVEDSSFTPDSSAVQTSKRLSFGPKDAQAEPRDKHSAEFYGSKDQQMLSKGDKTRDEEHYYKMNKSQSMYKEEASEREGIPPSYCYRNEEKETTTKMATPLLHPNEAYYKNERNFDEQRYYKSDHHYHRHENSRNKFHKSSNQHHQSIHTSHQRYPQNKYYQNKSQSKYHDHQYFSSAQAFVDNKKSHDHLYYSDRKK